MNFRNAVRISFLRVKKDMENLKNWINDWFIFLDNNQKELAVRIDKLERKIEELEKKRIEI